MKRCGQCEASIDDAAQFCPDCGTPQTDKAETQLQKYAQEELSSDPETADNDLIGRITGDPDRLWDRIAYVVGYVTVVLALSLITDPAGWPLLLAGLVILPPSRHLLGQPLGRPFIREFMVALYIFLVIIAVGLFVFL